MKLFNCAKYKAKHKKISLDLKNTNSYSYEDKILCGLVSMEESSEKKRVISGIRRITSGR